MYQPCGKLRPVDGICPKHLPDPFYLENEQRISLRGVICREMVSNILIHREFSSSYPAKFVIENNRIYTENANRASWSGEITLENFEPNPKIQSSPPFPQYRIGRQTRFRCA